MGHFLQITIARNTLLFLKKTIQFLVIANCRNEPLSANHDRKKNIHFLVIVNCRNGPLSANYNHKKNYTISRDCELQKRATFCKSRSQEKLYNFSRKTVQFLKKNCTISRDRELQKRATVCKSRSQEILPIFQEKLYNFS